MKCNKIAYSGTARGKHTVFTSDDEDVLEYLVHQDDKPESEMIGIANGRKIQHMRAYSELEARKERHRKVTSAAKDIATEKELLAKGARYKVRDADMENGTTAIFKWHSNESAESNGLLINWLSVRYK